jgi:hypothetical protein
VLKSTHGIDVCLFTCYCRSFFPSLNLVYHAADRRVDVRWQDRQPGADDVVTLLQAWWPQPFATDKADFLQRVAAAPALDFAQLGQQIASMPAAAPAAAAAAAASSNGAAGSSGAAGREVKLYHSRLADTPDWFKVRLWHGCCCCMFSMPAFMETLWHRCDCSSAPLSSNQQDYSSHAWQLGLGCVVMPAWHHYVRSFAHLSGHN